MRERILTAKTDTLILAIETGEGKAACFQGTPAMIAEALPSAIEQWGKTSRYYLVLGRGFLAPAGGLQDNQPNPYTRLEGIQEMLTRIIAGEKQRVWVCGPVLSKELK